MYVGNCVHCTTLNPKCMQVRLEENMLMAMNIGITLHYWSGVLVLAGWCGVLCPVPGVSERDRMCMCIAFSHMCAVLVLVVVLMW